MREGGKEYGGPGDRHTVWRERRGAEKRGRRESSLNVPELVRYSGPHFLRESKWKITCQAVM